MTRDIDDVGWNARVVYVCIVAVFTPFQVLFLIKLTVASLSRPNTFNILSHHQQ